MKFGLFNLMPLRTPATSTSTVLKDTLDMVGMAEQAGFEVAWFAEHHFSNYSISPSPVMMAAHVAGRTSRIKLGMAVLVLPLYHPMRLVQEIAMLDLQSGGRAVVGIGSGYQHYEFDRFGISLDDKIERMLEYWTVIESGLRTQHIDFQGKYVSAPDTHFLLAPLQKPFPPFFVASMTPPALKRAAETGATIFTSGTFLGTAGLITNRDKMHATLRKLGLPVDSVPLAVQQYIHVTHSKADAREAAEGVRYTARVLAALGQPGPTIIDGFIQPKELENEPLLETFEKNIIIGDPDYVAERIANDVALLNPVHYSCYFHFGGMDSGKAKKSMELFGSRVMPLLESRKQRQKEAATA